MKTWIITIKSVKKSGLFFVILKTPIYILKKIARSFNSLGKMNIKGETIKRINNYKMILNPSKAGIHLDLIKDRIREPYATQFLKKILKNGQTVLDIGANIGYYALLESKVVGDGGKVYAVEPGQENIDLLRRNIALNKVKNVEINQLAIGNKNGRLELNIYDASNLCSAFKHTTEDKLIKKIKVPMKSVDSFLKGRHIPDVIRMDTEGYEYYILKGMDEILKTNLPLILMMEFHFGILGKKKSTELLNLLKTKGFEILKITIEPRHVINPKNLIAKILNKITINLDSLVMGKPYKEGEINLTIDEMLENGKIMEGLLGVPQIFFKKKI